MFFVVLGGVGVLGVFARYSLGTFFSGSSFPWTTLIVNILGSFLIGCLYQMQDFMVSWISPQWTMAFMVGGLGALTTFSAYSLDTVRFFSLGAYGLAVLNILLNNCFSFFACYGGWKLGAWLQTRF